MHAALLCWLRDPSRPRVAMMPSTTTAAESGVRVALGPRSYDIEVVTGRSDEFGRFVRAAIDRTWSGASSRRAIIITDSNLASLPLPAACRAALATAGFESEIVVVPAGEATKSLAEASRLYDELVSPQGRSPHR